MEEAAADQTTCPAEDDDDRSVGRSEDDCDEDYEESSRDRRSGYQQVRLSRSRRRNPLSELQRGYR